MPVVPVAGAESRHPDKRGPTATGKMPVVPVAGAEARHPDKRGSVVGQSVSREVGSRRNGTMPMKVMPLRSVQGFS